MSLPGNDRLSLSQRYVEHKRIVLQWEQAFTKSTGRAPGRDDFRAAPQAVRNSYSRYREIKTYLDQCVKASKSSPCKADQLAKTPVKIFAERNSIRLSNANSGFSRHEEPQANGQRLENKEAGLNFKKFLLTGNRNKEKEDKETNNKLSAMAEKLFNCTIAVSANERDSKKSASKKNRTPSKLLAGASQTEDSSGVFRKLRSATTATLTAQDKPISMQMKVAKLRSQGILPFAISNVLKNPPTPVKVKPKPDPKLPRSRSPSSSPERRHVVEFTFGEIDKNESKGEERSEASNELELSFGTEGLRKAVKSARVCPDPDNSQVLSVDILRTPRAGRSKLRNVDTGWLSRCEEETDHENENEESSMTQSSSPLRVATIDIHQTEAPSTNEEVDIEPEAYIDPTSKMDADADKTEIPDISTDFMSSLASISDLDHLPSLLLDSTAIDIDFDQTKEIINPEIMIGEDEIRDLLKEINSLTRTPTKASRDSPYKMLEEIENTLNPSKEVVETGLSFPNIVSDVTTRKRPASPSPSASPTKEPIVRRKFFKSVRSEVIQKKVYTVRSYKPLTPVKNKPKVSRLLKPYVPAPSKAVQKGIKSVTENIPKVNSTETEAIPSPSQDSKAPVKRVTRSRTSQSESEGPSTASSLAIKSNEVKNHIASPVTSATRVTRSSLTPQSKVRAAAGDASKINSGPLSMKKIAEKQTTPGTQTHKYKHPDHYEVDTFDEVNSHGSAYGAGAPQRKGRRPRMTDKEYLQKKVASGRVNDNFVRIDVNKKVFVRGRKKINCTKIKKKEWKLKKSIAASEEKIKLMKCRKCGDVGHFSKYCMKGTDPKDLEPENTDASPFPTLQEAANMVWKNPNAERRTFVYDKGAPAQETEEVQEETQKNEKVPEEPFQKNEEFHETTSQTNSSTVSDTETMLSESESLEQDFADTGSSIDSSQQFYTVNPVFSANDDELNSADEIAELHQALKLFGYKDFRPGQQEAITRVLRGLSTLVVLSTGSGKSLCYFLPAYLYAKHNPGVITLCISPLVSLMEDQVQSIPAFLHGDCLHTNMTEKQREIVLDKVRNKKLSILLVSPEAVCGGLFGLLRNTNQFPPIAFACIDEVHCVSEWSHNFRPSYLKLCKILRDKLNVRTILGLTATSTTHTSTSVCEHLQVDPSTVIRGEIVPRNLRLSVSRDRDRLNSLIYLLSEKRFLDCDSIIIYCTRREECERVAGFLRTNLRDSRPVTSQGTFESRKRISTNCEAYHAGMSAARRRRVQGYFMSGCIRIVVATVAFGMGIDKSDIRAVIHYNMPKTFESYVQEIGRAGRDGLPAECHLFLDNAKGKDLCELKRHIYSNSVDRSTVRNLLSKIFKPCQCEQIEKIKGITKNTDKSKERTCAGHEVSFSVDSTVKELDLPEENIETLLCYLELDTSRKWIDMQPKCYQMCSIQSYGGTKLLKAAANKCPPLAVAIALLKERKKFKDDEVHLKFNFVEVAASVGWNSAVVRRELKSLEWTGTEFDAQGKPTKFRKSGIMVEFLDLAYRVVAPGQLTDDEHDTVLGFLHGRNVEQEQTQLYQLHRIYEAFETVSVPTVDQVADSFDEEKSDQLKKVIYDYFGQTTIACPNSWKMEIPASDLEREDAIRQDVQSFVNSHDDPQITGRTIAKIFQGISSPCFPATDWGRNRSFWRRYIDVDFRFICRIASEELIRRR